MKMTKEPEILVINTLDELEIILSWEKEISKIQYIERITKTPILSNYKVDEYDRYFADWGHQYNHLSKEAFEFYYNHHEPRMKKLGDELNKMVKEAQEHTTIENNPFCCGPDKKGF